MKSLFRVFMIQLSTIWANSRIFYSVFLNMRLKDQEENGQVIKLRNRVQASSSEPETKQS